MIELRRRYSSSAGGGQPSRLPAGYQEVEWIGTGDDKANLPYILTDIYPDMELGYECECAIPTSAHNVPPELDYLIFGCDKGWNNAGYALGFNNSYTTFLGIFFHNSGSMISPNSYTGIQPTSGEFNTYKYSYGQCSINSDIVKKDNFTSDAVSNTRIQIFGLNRSGTYITSECGIKIKSLYFFKGDVTNKIANLIPCYRTSDHKPGMYDIVNDVFYTNDGTGEFLVGADVGAPKLPIEYQEVEYLESNGTQYFDSGVGIYVGMEIEADIMPKNEAFAFGFFESGNKCAVGFSEKYYVYTDDISNESVELSESFMDKRIVVKLANGEQSINGVVYSNTTMDVVHSSGAVYVFALNGEWSTTPVEYFIGRFYRFKIKGHRDFIPCYRKADNVAGMYDLVSGEFFTNAGTGEFIVGADVGGSNTDIEYLTAIDVTGGSITTDWIPQAGAIVKWDCIMADANDNPTAALYFSTYPREDVNYRTFEANSNGAGRSYEVFCWLNYSYQHGASAWEGEIFPPYQRVLYEWNSLSGKAGYNNYKNINIKTSSSNYPLQLFCGRDDTRTIIYKVELINQDGDNMTLRPARKDGVIGFVCEETGIFWSSNNGVEFTIYEE